MPMFLFITFLLYALGLVLTAVGSRLSGRCATWCCALCGFPMWVAIVMGTITGSVGSASVADKTVDAAVSESIVMTHSKADAVDGGTSASTTTTTSILPDNTLNPSVDD